VGKEPPEGRESETGGGEFVRWGGKKGGSADKGPRGTEYKKKKETLGKDRWQVRPGGGGLVCLGGGGEKSRKNGELWVGRGGDLGVQEKKRKKGEKVRDSVER